METKINVAEILKDKPQGTKLYDWLHNIDVEFSDVETTEIETSIWCTRDKEGYNELFGYSKLGTLRGWFDGLQILLPSREMRDWSKFVWKKGDVLVHKDGDVHIIFEGFVDDMYLTFKGKYYLWENNDHTEQFDEHQCYMKTSVFIKANDDDTQTYINTIEEKLGGKLNRETLEVEKAQPEFKDGDIVTAVFTDGNEMICVFKEKIEQDYMGYCGFFSKGKFKGKTYLNFGDDCICDDTSISKEIRLATEAEKQQLFDALAKEGKAWDAEKKQIVNLKPKVELKPFDKVLVRNCYTQRWRVNFFSSITKEGCYICASGSWNECIPYNEETAKLIGTTNSWEG